jgi:hypothetical protein
MGECLEVLSSQPEYEGDEILARLVRMQLVTEKISLGAWYHSTISNQPAPAPLGQLYTMHAELEALWNSFPVVVKTDSEHHNSYNTNIARTDLQQIS